MKTKMLVLQGKVIYREERRGFFWDTVSLMILINKDEEWKELNKTAEHDQIFMSSIFENVTRSSAIPPVILFKPKWKDPLRTAEVDQVVEIMFETTYLTLGDYAIGARKWINPIQIVETALKLG